MEHAILIVDMPESINGEVPCEHCSLHVAEYDDYYHHYVCQSIRTNISADKWEIYKKCPLKLLRKEPINILIDSNRNECEKENGIS